MKHAALALIRLEGAEDHVTGRENRQWSSSWCTAPRNPRLAGTGSWARWAHAVTASRWSTCLPASPSGRWPKPNVIEDGDERFDDVRMFLKLNQPGNLILRGSSGYGPGSSPSRRRPGSWGPPAYEVSWASARPGPPSPGCGMALL